MGIVKICVAIRFDLCKTVISIALPNNRRVDRLLFALDINFGFGKSNKVIRIAPVNMVRPVHTLFPRAVVVPGLFGKHGPEYHIGVLLVVPDRFGRPSASRVLRRDFNHSRLAQICKIGSFPNNDIMTARLLGLSPVSIDVINGKIGRDNVISRTVVFAQNVGIADSSFSERTLGNGISVV